MRVHPAVHPGTVRVRGAQCATIPHRERGGWRVGVRRSHRRPPCRRRRHRRHGLGRGGGGVRPRGGHLVRSRATAAPAWRLAAAPAAPRAVASVAATAVGGSRSRVGRRSLPY